MRSELIKHKTFCMGFSLIELSISMVVIGLLFGIFLIPFAKQREIKQFQETRYQIDKI
jgi:prepilin-type N-terminal cleavage/methylation domain-containing protein